VSSETPQTPTGAALSFIHSTLDDAGLSPTEFRLYCHVLRRSGSSGYFDESGPNAARVCRVNQKTWRRSVKRLVDLHMLEAKPRTGATTIYKPASPNTWRSYPNGYLGTRLGTVSKRVGTLPKRIPGDPTQTNTHKGSPIEGSPLKDLPPSDAVEMPNNLNTPQFLDAWRDWQEYRLSLGGKNMNPARMFREQLRWLAQFPTDTATEILRQSMRNGWQGLFELKHEHTPKHKNHHPENHRNSGIAADPCEIGRRIAAKLGSRSK
jgi:hypothetical protein